MVTKGEVDLRLKKELAVFGGFWEGGFFEGDPLNPLGESSYLQLGYISVLHATYLRCIKPYVNDQTVTLEIGPGGGAWTKALLRAKEIYALDALPESHNRLLARLGNPTNVKYFQVADFKCAMIPDDHLDYMFSYGCLCHISFDGIKEYATNLFPKLKKGSNCFWMIADYDKYNAAVASLSIWNVFRRLEPAKKGLKRSLFRWVYDRLTKNYECKIVQNKHEDTNIWTMPRWYHAGIDRVCAMLKEVGYKVVDPDVGTCLRDPIVHFSKP